MNESNIRQALVDTGIKLLENKLAEGKWGSMSARIDARYMLVTPSGFAFSSLTPQDLVVVDLDTLEYEGDIKPSSESKLYAAIYLSRPETNAVLHSHPRYCSSVAAAGRDMPVMSGEMQKIIGGAARVADYALPGTKKLVDFTLRALTGRNACLMANHGVVCCGESIDAAYSVCQVIERSCRTFIEQETLYLSEKDTFSEDDLFAIFKAGAQS
ncbi:MAG: class II aldolase/adducin family protein [Clostridia bacterium]